MTAWRFTRARGSVFAYGCVCVCVCTYLFYPHPRRRRRRRLTRRSPTVLVVHAAFVLGRKTNETALGNRSINQIDRSRVGNANEVAAERLDDSTTRRLDDDVSWSGRRRRRHEPQTERRACARERERERGA
jgi:hypothetical protein